jgi:hypothetical protein
MPRAASQKLTPNHRVNRTAEQLRCPVPAPRRPVTRNDMPMLLTVASLVRINGDAQGEESVAPAGRRTVPAGDIGAKVGREPRQVC